MSNPTPTGQDEARRALADQMADILGSSSASYNNAAKLGFLLFDNLPLILAALRAPSLDRGAEERAVRAFKAAALEAVQDLLHATACNFTTEYSGSLGEARLHSFYEAGKAIEALPVPADLNEGGGK